MSGGAFKHKQKTQAHDVPISNMRFLDCTLLDPGVTVKPLSHLSHLSLDVSGSSGWPNAWPCRGLDPQNDGWTGAVCSSVFALFLWTLRWAQRGPAPKGERGVKWGHCDCDPSWNKKRCFCSSSSGWVHLTRGAWRCGSTTLEVPGWTVNSLVCNSSLTHCPLQKAPDWQTAAFLADMKLCMYPSEKKVWPSCAGVLVSMEGIASR